MTIENNNSEYWGRSYVDYWKDKVTNANNGNLMATTTDGVYASFIRLLEPRGRVIEIGCGFGRGLPEILAYAHTIVATDISSQMIDEAKRLHSAPNIEFLITSAENTNFPDKYFDALICFAVFDCLNQPVAWREFMRILRPGGRLLITGKNIEYRSDDDEALIAEIRARAKGHPNSFTNVVELLESSNDYGIVIDHVNLYERRGDMNSNSVADRLSGPFYEFAIFARRTEDEIVKTIDSSRRSKTFEKLVLTPLGVHL